MSTFMFSGRAQKQLEGLHESREQEAERPRVSRESPDEAVHRRLAGRGMDVHRGEAGACGAEFVGSPTSSVGAEFTNSHTETFGNASFRNVWSRTVRYCLFEILSDHLRK